MGEATAMNMKLLSILIAMLPSMCGSDSVHITTPAGARIGPWNCIKDATMRLYMGAVQEQRKATVEATVETKRVAFATYEDVRDVLVHVDNIKTMLREVVEKEMILTTLTNQLLNDQTNVNKYLPQYATKTNSRLFALEQEQIELKTELTEMKKHFDVRLDKVEEMIVASAGLSQTAIITYSVVILVSLAVILAAVMLCVSYFATNATPETPFVQRMAHCVWRALPFDAQSSSSITVHAPSTVPDMPPSYSTVDISLS